jgi:DegV family protein with EDD domain
MIKIITDSTVNLPDDVIEMYDIRLAPITVQFGSETYEEGIDIDRDLFYQKIDEMGIIPTTSQPTPASFEKYYRELHEAGHSGLVITITSKHSGTYESAILAQSMVPEADIVVFDSLNISMGSGWQVLEAARLLEAGATREEVLERLTYMRDNTSLFFTPATLKYLQMSGRVSALKGALGSILDLKPIIGLSEGELAVESNVRTRGRAVEQIISRSEEIHGKDTPINVAVFHARAPGEARELHDKVKQRFNCQETIVVDIVLSLAVHGGPGLIGIIAYPV